MSQALQRVVVRMMVDSAFVARVFAGEPLPELDAREQGWLLACDPRAFGTDRYRRGRLLQALIEEYPASVALGTGGGRVLDRIDGFLSSETFHAAIQGRQAVALAFGTWLPALVGDVARLEHAIAVARRRRWTEPGDGLVIAPGIWPVALAAGTVAHWQQVRSALGEAPLRALVEGIALPEATPSDELEHVLLTDGGTALHWLSEGIHALLDRCRERVARDEVVALGVALGLDAADADEIVAELVADGWLTS